LPTDPDYSTHLTAAEIERLAFLIEELSEAQKAACKILRHGFGARNPLLPESPDNRAHLTLELGHVLAGLDLLAGGNDVLLDTVQESRMQKLVDLRKTEPYRRLHFQKLVLWSE
jgi:hypothetical protein